MGLEFLGDQAQPAKEEIARNIAELDQLVETASDRILDDKTQLRLSLGQFRV